VPAEERQAMAQRRDLRVLQIQRLGQRPHEVLEHIHFGRQVVQVDCLHIILDPGQRAIAARNSQFSFSLD
jgi:hypothetical protein